MSEESATTLKGFRPTAQGCDTPLSWGEAHPESPPQPWVEQPESLSCLVVVLALASASTLIGWHLELTNRGATLSGLVSLPRLPG